MLESWSSCTQWEISYRDIRALSPMNQLMITIISRTLPEPIAPAQLASQLLEELV
jgi:hypothetical protein